MSLAGFKAGNHPQQVASAGAKDMIDDRATLPEWFADLHERFRFTIDVAASATNTKLPRYYDIAADGLSKSWAGERVWCNPPFSNLGAWAAKARAEAWWADLIVMLVPANRTEQGWWHEHVEPFRDRPGGNLTVEFVRHRRRFIRVGQDGVLPNDRPPFGVCLLIWQSQPVIRFGQP